MKQSIQLRLGQHLTMTPQLQQAIRLLQLSTLELHCEIQQALDSNLMLELDEEEGGGLAGASLALHETAVQERAQVNEGASDAASEFEGNAPDVETIDEVADTGWEDSHEAGEAYPQTRDHDGRDYEAQDSIVETLRDHLVWQMRLTPFSEADMMIAASIIDSVGDDGYLTSSLEDIQAGLRGALTEEDAAMDAIEAVLHRVQNFDPVGVASRDLRECLLVQLQQCASATPLLAAARQLVSDHLPLLASRDYVQLRRRLGGLGEDELRAVIDFVQRLNPRPGEQVTESHAEYVLPDVYVKKHKGVWQVLLNPGVSPRVRINNQYAGLIRRADSSPDNATLKNHLQEARWFIKSLQSRNETLLKVANCIVERQQAFLEHGEEAMRPLVLHDVSEALGMHESTISRVTRQKFMHTPRGIFELKYFFSSHVGTDSGGECSATAIRAFIKKLVAAEHTTKPLSDSKIAGILVKQGINVARRTVAKYRETLAIPPSNERRRMA
ncbi:MAG: RNA polymerase factor sigma-54 [Gammaproteobacteria bacterium]|nr:RNA polymerase factor sigma-54 [Gammaproteobacteria bacterium]